MTWPAARARRDLPRERRQPVLRAAARPRRRRPRAARRRTAWPAAAASRARSRRRWSGSSRRSPRGARAARRRRDRRATRSTPSSPTRSPGSTPTPASPRWTSCSTTRLLHATSVPRRFAFRHPLVRRAVYESTRRRLAAGRPRPRGRGAGGARRLRRPRARITSSSRRPRATRRRSRVLLEAASATAPRAPADGRALVRGRAAAAARGRRGGARPHPGRASRRRSARPATSRAARRGSPEALDLLGAGRDRHARHAAWPRRAAAEHFLGRHETADAAARRRARGAAGPRLRGGGHRAAGPDRRSVLRARRRRRAARSATRRSPIATRARRSAADRARPRPRSRTRTPTRATSTGRRAALALAAPPLDAAGDDALARHLDAVNRLAWSEHLIERDDDAIRHAERGIAIARATGQDQFVPMLAGALALSLVRKGELAAAAAALRRGARDGRARRQRLRHLVGADDERARRGCAPATSSGSRRDAERATALADGRAGRIAAMALARLAVTRRAQGERPDGVEALHRARSRRAGRSATPRR